MKRSQLIVNVPWKTKPDTVDCEEKKEEKKEEKVLLHRRGECPRLFYCSFFTFFMESVYTVLYKQAFIYNNKWF